jgi:hypothetical protein
MGIKESTDHLQNAGHWIVVAAGEQVLEYKIWTLQIFNSLLRYSIERFHANEMNSIGVNYLEQVSPLQPYVSRELSSLSREEQDHILNTINTSRGKIDSSVPERISKINMDLKLLSQLRDATVHARNAAIRKVPRELHLALHEII